MSKPILKSKSHYMRLVWERELTVERMSGNNQLEMESFLFIQGNNQQVPVKNEVDNSDALRKVDTKSSSEKKVHKASKEDVCSEKQDIPSVEVCTSFFLAYSSSTHFSDFGYRCLCNDYNCTCLFPPFERSWLSCI